MSLPVLVLDGRYTIGGNKILLKKDNRGLLLDFGLNFNTFGKYYEEYLKPRCSCVGIRDYWDLDIIPHYKELYRSDLVLGEYHNTNDLGLEGIDGVYLSHAHVDHCGLIGLLGRELPLIASATTLAMLRAVQDSGRSEVQSQICYSSSYVPAILREHNVLDAPHHSKDPHLGRKAYIASNDLTPELRELWERTSNPTESSQKRKMRKGEIQNLSDKEFDWDIEIYPVDHSIPGASAVKIEMEQGAIVYTGDLRLSGARRIDTEKFTDAIRNPWVLIIEGTQASREAECETTEAECHKNSLELVERYPGRLIVADFAARNIERLKVFAEIAQEIGRTFVVTVKDIYALDCLSKVPSSIPIPDNIGVFDAPKSDEEGWEKWVYSKYNGSRITPDRIKSSPGDFLVCFSFFDIKYLNDIKPDGGLYLYSSSEPFSEDQQLDFKRLQSWLIKYGLDLHGLENEDESWVLEEGYHCSGHATRTQLEEITKKINPEKLIPVHTTNREWFRGLGYDMP